uniref:Uncharacterized protein n=1 Tax=Taeniopygia guttata TaxID=59729 RepID=A0A674H7K7_TAEGU
MFFFHTSPGTGGRTRPTRSNRTDRLLFPSVRISPGREQQPSYWLDLWLFILFDLALFLFIYLLP